MSKAWGGYHNGQFTDQGNGCSDEGPLHPCTADAGMTQKLIHIGSGGRVRVHHPRQDTHQIPGQVWEGQKRRGEVMGKGSRCTKGWQNRQPKHTDIILVSIATEHPTQVDIHVLYHAVLVSIATEQPRELLVSIATQQPRKVDILYHTCFHSNRTTQGSYVHIHVPFLFP